MCSPNSSTPPSPPRGDHLQGKTIPEHLKEAREKGARSSEQVHGVELSGTMQAACDAAKETAIYLSILYIISPMLIPFFALGLCIWKTGRAAFLGWSRLNRLNQLIAEEYSEIQNSRDTEQLELTEIYRAKGFESPLLEQVVQVLMADENRLLTVMLEEELGLQLGGYEHPLKQGFGAFMGVVLSAVPLILAVLVSPLLFYGILFTIFLIATTLSIYPQKHSFISFNVWALSLAFLVVISMSQLHGILAPLFARILKG
ncbi:MAG: VIT1/CCC1 transporter family protein [Chlamydiia bacterium]